MANFIRLSMVCFVELQSWINYTTAFDIILLLTTPGACYWMSNVVCHTDAYSLRHTLQCAVSHVINVTGAHVNCICSMTDKHSLDVVIVNRSRIFLHNLCKLHYQLTVLYHRYSYCGQYVLFRLDAFDCIVDCIFYFNFFHCITIELCCHELA